MNGKARAGHLAAYQQGKRRRRNHNNANQLTFMKVPLIYSAASLPKTIAASTLGTPNCTITESVSP